LKVIVMGGFLRLGDQGASLGIMRRPPFHGLGGKVLPPHCAETQPIPSFKVFSRPMLPALSPLAPKPRYKLRLTASFFWLTCYKLLIYPPATGGKAPSRSPSFRTSSPWACTPFKKITLGALAGMFIRSRSPRIVVPSATSTIHDSPLLFSGKWVLKEA